ncbi:MAG: DUF1772 domain-containing protein, partial [Bacteroidota bacterium]
FKMIVLLFGILFTGMTAGVCFTWSNAVTPGIGRLDDLSFLKSFQSMNRVIINGKFLVVFFTPALLLFLNAYLFKATGVGFKLYLTAAFLFFAGVGLVTVLGNVPLNEILDQAHLDNLPPLELAELRQKFEQPWNQWHLVRTITSFLSFALLLMGLIYTNS